MTMTYTQKDKVWFVTAKKGKKRIWVKRALEHNQTIDSTFV